MSITITVPNDDHVALRAMAKALEEIAVARGAPSQDKQIGELNYRLNIDTTQASAALKELVKQAEVDTTTQQVESLAIPVEANGATYETDLGSDNPQAVPVADSTGTPWDERIHSASKALNSDGTWRVRRKPADKTPEEWAEYIKWVEEDIHLVKSLSTGESDDEQEQAMQKLVDTTQEMGLYAIEPPVTPQGDDFHVDAGVVTEQEVAAIPAPPLPVPPVSIANTIPESMRQPYYYPEVESLTFPQVMQFLTERHGRITSPEVDQIIADMGLTSIMDLNTQPEHTGPFIARVKAHLGE